MQQFLNHLEQAIPNEQNRNVLLSYMANCVRFVGLKQQWCPVLIGPGASLLNHCLIMSIGEGTAKVVTFDDLVKNVGDHIKDNYFLGVEHHAETEQNFEAAASLLIGAPHAYMADNVTQVENLCNFMVSSSRHEFEDLDEAARFAPIELVESEDTAAALEEALANGADIELGEWFEAYDADRMVPIAPKTAKL